MIRFKKIWVAAVCMVFISAMTIAQEKDDNDYSNNRGTKNPKTEAPAHHPTLIKHIKRIVGVWELESVYDGKKDITDNDTVGAIEQIEFTIENKYKRYTKNEQIDSGVFTMNENHSLVYLESKTGGETTSWSIGLNDDNNSMTMQPARVSNAAQGKQFKFVYRRKSDQ
jgi:hypothetical protein